MSLRKLAYLAIVASLTALIAFTTGCTPEHEVEVQADPGEAGEIEGEGTYEEGEEVAVEVEPEEGYEFEKWEEDGEKITSDKDYKLEVSDDITLEAQFEKIKHEVSLELDDEEKGNVSGSGTYEYGEEVTLEAEPEERYEFEKWEKDDAKVSSQEKHEFEVTEDKSFEALFSLSPPEKLSTEVGEWQIEQDNVTISELDSLAVKENWQEEDYQIGSKGENFLAGYNREKEKVDIIAKDNLTVIEQFEEVKNPDEAFDFLGQDHMLYRNIGDEESYIYRITHEGKELVEEINIYESGLSIPDDENDQLSQIDSNIDSAINIDFEIVDDYLFVFPDYSNVLSFEEPPRLKEPVLKIFQFNDEGLEEVENDLLEEPLLTTDIVEFKDDKALLSTACQGLIEIDLTDFSLEKQNFGGNYNLPEENKPLGEGYQDSYVGHFFRGVSSEGAIFMRTHTPVPKCHSYKKHIVAPTDDGSFEIIGESEAGVDADRNPIVNLGMFPLERKEDWLAIGQGYSEEDDLMHSVAEEFECGGIFALLELDNEKIRQANNTNGSNLPEINEYFDINIDLGSILSDAGVSRLPNIVAWEAEGQEKISNYYRRGSSRSLEAVVFSQIDDDYIELRYTTEEVNVLDIDYENKEIYLEEDEDLYRLDYYELFNN